MGFLDDAKARLEQLAQDHPEQVESISDQVITRGGDAVDSVTGGKYAEHVDTAQARADEAVGGTGTTATPATERPLPEDGTAP